MAAFMKLGLFVQFLFIYSQIEAKVLNSQSVHTRSQIDKVLSKIIKPDDKLALLVDFDGTLAEINPYPILTSIDPNSEKYLKKLITHPNIYIAIISGRRVNDVKQRVGINNITYSGNHGMELTFANQTDCHYPISPDIYQNCSLLRQELEEKVAKNTAWVENKNVSLTYHYRQVPIELQEEYLTEARKLVLKYGYIPVQAHYAIEIKPPVVWSKGDAARLILNEVFGDAWKTNKTKVIFAGDDNSDEDVMRILKGNALSFRVSNSPDIITHADYVLDSVETVTYLLEWLDNFL